MHKVTDAQYLHDYEILLTFEDKKRKVVDFKEALDNFEGPIFKPLKDIEFFKNFEIMLGTVVWYNEADVSPDYLYEIGLNEI